ncbi:MAG TPA: PEP/pyruvate-binding domain-containing protein, partial [Herpetosiphonaceae bacterium]|nr:PEP/pyruvate-binding domain-containing protein [Herpetosiphonaceae bacterium]
MATISTGFTIPLAELDRDALPIAGGKGANLGAMLRAGLPVPPGFCVTADTYRTVVAGAAPAISRQLSGLDIDDNQALETASQAIRSEIERLHIPDEVAEAIRAAYAALPSGQGREPAVAVRSSATAEDLPDASFAGQQETLLNVRGADAVRDAVRRCWSSLWTPRAIAYRTHNGFEHDAVALAVVVQSMIDSEVSGVLFTADPVTGNRTHTVVNASWGLGEAIVSGLVSPDGWVLDQDGQILAEEIAKKERMIVYDQRGGTEERSVPIELQQSACLDASDLARLVALGRAAQEYFGAPQDIEWASRDRQHYLLQSRPITTLFPLPEPRPVDDDLHVYLSGNALQGVMEPITPMGQSIFREMAAVFQSVTGAQIVPRGKPGLLVEAAGRLYIDATPALRNPI